MIYECLDIEKLYLDTKLLLRELYEYLKKKYLYLINK